MQQTVAKSVCFAGIGLHSGDVVHVEILPAASCSGIVFRRIDIHGKSQDIQATFDNVSNTELCTVISNKDKVSVSTIEHLMSALWACGIDNAVIAINGPEVPIMDGSAAPFVDLLSTVGVLKQRKKRKLLKIKQSLRVSKGEHSIELCENRQLSIDFSIYFPHCTIGKQSYVFNELCDTTYYGATHKVDIMHHNVDAVKFVEEIGCARTFGFKHDLDKLHSMGLAKGASLENSIGLDEKSVLNKTGLRFKNEFVRHKILDCVGDLYLAGMRIIGHIRASCAGHTLNNAVLHTLFESAKNYDII